MQVTQTSHRYVVVRADLTGRPGGPVRPQAEQKPYRGTSIKIPPYDGSKLWREIHEVALTAAGPAWLNQIRLRLPCGECRAHWDGMLVRTPPDWANFFEWTVDRHNEVNVRLGKPVMSHETAREIYSKLRHA